MEEEILCHQKISELRARLVKTGKLEEHKLKSDKFLGRYIQFNDNCVDKAEKMLDFYVDRNRGLSSLCKQANCHLLNMEFPNEFRTEFNGFIGGRDHHNRPIGFILDTTNFCVKKYLATKDYTDILSDYSLKLRLMMEKELLERDVDYGMMLIDMKNLPYFQYFHKRTLEYVMELLKLTELHSPGVVRVCMLVNAPKIFKIVMDTMMQIIKPNIKVIIFSSTDKNWKMKLRTYFPEDGILPEFGGTLPLSQVIEC